MPVVKTDNDIRIYAACTAPLEDERLFDAAYSAASPARREKVDRLRFKKDKRLSLGAELLLRRALADAGIGSFPPEFILGPHGKPEIAGQNVKFNLSHSGEWAVCAVSRHEVGCDIEHVKPRSLKTAKRFFTAGEYALITAQKTEEKRTEMFYRCWTLKESFVKATGVGLSLPLGSFEILPGEKSSAELPYGGKTYSFREYTDIPGYCCALCAEGEIGEVPMHAVNIKQLIAG